MATTISARTLSLGRGGGEMKGGGMLCEEVGGRGHVGAGQAAGVEYVLVGGKVRNISAVRATVVFAKASQTCFRGREISRRISLCDTPNVPAGLCSWGLGTI